MEAKDILDRFIEREKSLMPSPGFAESVMSRIESEEGGRAERLFRNNLLRISVVAASIAVAILVGVAVGGSYGHPATERLVTDDAQIERLHFYTDHVDE